MTHRSVLAALLCALVGVGCAGEKQTTVARSPEPAPNFDYLFPGPEETKDDLACPAALPGTRVASIPTDSGSLLVFTTDNGMLELRRRAQKLASELEREVGSSQPSRGLAGISTTTRYEEIPEGATVEVRATDPKHSLALRDRLESIVREMQKQRDCPDTLLAAR